MSGFVTPRPFEQRHARDQDHEDVPPQRRRRDRGRDRDEPVAIGPGAKANNDEGQRKTKIGSEIWIAAGGTSIAAGAWTVSASMNSRQS